jgi:hypothetical protein
MVSERGSGPRPRRVPREDSILVRYPHLAEEADHERAADMGLDFWSIAPGTKAMLPWRHVTGDRRPHPWLQSGSSRVHMKAGCSICRGYSADPTTSLAALCPDLARGWHPTRNGTRTPHDITPGSHHDVWWTCRDCAFEWSARISSRALGGNGCRRCAGQEPLPGDAATLAMAQPDLYAELDAPAVAAMGIDPLAVHVRSNRTLPWVCRDDTSHRWTTSPAARMNGCVCPRCPSLGWSSAVERRLLDLLTTRFPDAAGDAAAGETRWTNSRGHSIAARCDVVSASARLVVEYDGVRFHRDVHRRRCDVEKSRALLADGWRVVRVRERAGRRTLTDLELVGDGLLQIQHTYGDSMLPVVNAIADWIAELG